MLAVVMLAGIAQAQSPTYGSTTPPHLLQDNSRLEHDIYFSGAVQLEDGTPPPEAVAMIRVCNGQAHFATWTDAKGGFSFHVGASGRDSPQADASETGMPPAAMGPSLSPMNDFSTSAVNALRGCEVQARLAGYQSDKLSIAVTSHFDDSRLGVITLHPISKASALTVSATTLQAPAAARKAYEKGLDALEKEKSQIAVDEFTKAVTAYPNFAAAWHQLGLLRQKRNDDAGALDAWKHAVASDPKFLTPYEHLTLLAGSKQDWVSSEAYSRAWIQLDSEDFPGAYLFNAIANSRLNRMEAAEAAARAGLHIDKTHRVPKLNFVLAMVLMAKHQNAEAAQHFREYLALAPDAKDAGAVRQQLAQLEAAAAARPQ
jgi:tetratricopeptide (TPR) repeat protein